MNASSILRTLALLLLACALCVSASAQETSSQGTLDRAPTAENGPPQIPGDPVRDSFDREDVKRQDLHPRLGKTFWGLWIANLALTVASIELTENCIHSHQCVEGNPLLGKRPGRLELYGIRMGLLGAGFYVARKSKLEGGSFWKYGTVAVTTAFAADTAWDAYGTTTRHGTQNSRMVANRPASQFEIISIHKPK